MLFCYLTTTPPCVARNFGLSACLSTKTRFNDVACAACAHSAVKTSDLVMNLIKNTHLFAAMFKSYF